MIKHILKNGFTLVELLVAISIATIIMAAVVPQTLRFNAQSQLRAESRKVGDVLNLAKAKGNSADSSTSCTDNFQGYGIIITSITSYKLKLCCSQVCTDAQSSDIQSYTLPTNITFIAPSINTLYRFKPLSETIISPIGQSTITLKQSGINSCLSTTVSTSGLIQTDSSPVTCP